MLTDQQINKAWQSMFEAEVRSFYFGDLASRYTLWKKLVMAASFILSSIAAALVLGGVWHELLPVVLNLLIALISGISIGFSLDEQVSRMVRLRHSWSQIAARYEQLWNRWNDENAESVLLNLQQQSRELSDEGLKAPCWKNRIEHWYDHVRSRHPEAGKMVTTSG